MIEAIFLKENLASTGTSRSKRHPSVTCLAEFCTALLFVLFSLIFALILRLVQVSNMQVKRAEIMIGTILKASHRRPQLEPGVVVCGNVDVLMAQSVCESGRIGTSMRVFRELVEVFLGTADLEQFGSEIDNAKAVFVTCIAKLLLKVPSNLGSHWKEKDQFICLPRIVGVLL